MEDQNQCCPKFDPTPFQEKEHIWKDKLFAKGYVNQIFHMPLNMGKVVTEIYSKIQSSNAEVPTQEFLMLAYDPSPWKSELYFTVSKAIPSMENVKLSGKFISKVFDGPFNAVPNWITECEKYLAEKQLKALKYYFYFTTCPKCANKYGHNYVVVFMKIGE